MMNKTMVRLEFNKILDKLCEHAISEGAKKRLSQIKPYLHEGEAKAKMNETTDGRKMLDRMGLPPLAAMNEMDEIMMLLGKDAMLLPEQFTHIAQFIAACKRLRAYLKRGESSDSNIAFYGNSIYDLGEVFEEIERSIRNNSVDEEASSELRNIRRKLENIDSKIRSKLESILKNNKEYFSDGYIAMRNGSFVLPVKKEYKNKIGGTVIDTSSKGSTYFIEPSGVSKLQEERSILKIEEDNEVRRILYTLTALVESYSREIHMNIELMETIDEIFARAKLSAELNGISVPLLTDRKIKIIQGRHPFIDPKACVPLDFEIGEAGRGIVITGPNTGGKTVALKTVGLLSMMAQSGLHVPVQEGSLFCMHNMVLCDIGDGQSITDHLSTFSAHITNVKDILNHSNEESFILLDELGTGTDPAEGMGIAIAILEELRAKECLFVVTTHYPEVKDYAQKTNGLINARMGFDRESLNPLYKLEIGEAGESCALYIAERLGLPARMLEIAYKEAYGEFKSFSSKKISEEQSNIHIPRIQKEVPKKSVENEGIKFNIGDSVMVYPQKDVGIVYQSATPMGEVGVQIKGKKQKINYKRIKLLVSAQEMYPEDYDFATIFEEAKIRKARKKMGKKYDPNIEITIEKNDENYEYYMRKKD